TTGRSAGKAMKEGKPDGVGTVDCPLKSTTRPTIGAAIATASIAATRSLLVLIDKPPWGGPQGFWFFVKTKLPSFTRPWRLFATSGPHLSPVRRPAQWASTYRTPHPRCAKSLRALYH